MALFTKVNRLFYNCFKFKSYISRSIISPTTSRFRRTTSITGTYKPFEIARTFPSSPETLRIQFYDCLDVDFYYIWLRNSCKCKECVNPKTKQRLLDTVSLDLDINPKFSYITHEGKLKIVWPDGEKEHTSEYNPMWLYRYGLGFERNLYEKVHDLLPPIECWNSSHLQENLPEIEYREVMECQRGINLWLENMYKYGMVIMKNAPSETGEVTKVMNRITHVMNTRWGSSFHITTEDSQKPNYLPYQGKNLDLHTDMNYLDKTPGIQIFHCLEANYKNPAAVTEDDSGKFVFLDGFNAANCLKKHHPIYFDILASVPVKFYFNTSNMMYSNYQPILKLNKSREVAEIHYNNRSMGPLEGPVSSIFNFFAAYKTFGECIRQDENHFKFILEPGKMIAFNNRRILNGRRSFDPNLVNIHLEGCYADMDEIIARYRAFLAKKSTIGS